MAADAAALRDRIAKVKRSRQELVTLWHEAVAAADDATKGCLSPNGWHSTSRPRNPRTLHARRRSLSRHRTGEQSTPSRPLTRQACAIRPSSLSYAHCIPTLSDRPSARR
jgi:hypothetical protein